MPFTSQQVKAIAAKKTQELGPKGAEKYMHNLKLESLRKYGYFISNKPHVKKKPKRKVRHAQY